MEAIEGLNIFSGAKVGLLMGLIIGFLGLFLYVFLNVWSSSRVKKFRDLNLRLWWDENQISFVFTTLICIGIFIGNYYTGTLTINRCFMIGFMGQFAADKIIKIRNK